MIPIQERFLQGNDDVRTGVIKNMAKFWRCLSHEKREESAMVVMACSDNEQKLTGLVNHLRETHTWRLRLEISRQLPDFAAELNSQVVLKVLAPLFMDLLNDPVCVVREMT